MKLTQLKHKRNFLSLPVGLYGALKKNYGIVHSEMKMYSFFFFFDLNLFLYFI